MAHEPADGAALIAAERARQVEVRRGAQLAALRLLAERHPVEFASLLEAARWGAGLAGDAGSDG